MDRRAGLRTKRRPFATAAASRMSATAATAAAAAAMGSGLEPLHEHAARLVQTRLGCGPAQAAVKAGGAGNALGAAGVKRGSALRHGGGIPGGGSGRRKAPHLSAGGRWRPHLSTPKAPHLSSGGVRATGAAAGVPPPPPQQH